MLSIDFKQWTQAHWTVLVLSIAALGSVISGLDHWSDLGRPAVFGGLLLQLATTWRALTIPAPAPTPPSNEKVPQV